MVFRKPKKTLKTDADISKESMNDYFERAQPGHVFAVTDFVRFGSYGFDHIARTKIMFKNLEKQNRVFKLAPDVYAKLDPKNPESTKQPSLDEFARAFARTGYRIAYPSSLEALYIVGISQKPEKCIYLASGKVSDIEYMGRTIHYEVRTNTDLDMCKNITQTICQVFNGLGWEHVKQREVVQIASILTPKEYEQFKEDLQYAPETILKVGNRILKAYDHLKEGKYDDVELNARGD